MQIVSCEDTKCNINITFFSPLKNILLFKGGTCIKKCYIPDYRFSEDLVLLSLTGGHFVCHT
ncbi:MAG: nucleotidyl transferase AbiEii/AbiGii toxin family protein [Atribacterota bacterium]|nr:nucleotidyl transferase AbiEii/AbiGii toxin family protein [Atribacterota bacterium]